VSLAALFSKRLLIFSGKGGVGKSTITAATAVAAARAGKRVLIVEIGEHEAISRIFAVPPVGYGGGTVYRPHSAAAPPISAMSVTALEALREYAMRTVKFQMIYNAVFDNPVVRYFTAAAPGLEELNVLGKIESLHREVIAPAPNARYDLMLLDAPSTGHALAFFQAPPMALRMSPPGAIHAMLQKMWNLLIDPHRTALNIVTRPEDMPVNESIEFDAAATALGIPRGVLIVNGVCPELFANTAVANEALARVRIGTPLAQTIVDVARSTVAKRDEQLKTIARLAAIPSPEIVVPLITGPRFGLGDVERLADALAASSSDV
jgi:anion-transporting  ArsA/GET3 family ATPase